jgi:hypothetical protein
VLEGPYGGKVTATVEPLPGPWSNNTSGEGWRLLSAVEAGALGAWPFKVDAAVSSGELLNVWNELSPGTNPPYVDFATEIVAFFGEAHGSSCPDVRFDNVVIDNVGRVVYDEVSNPLGNIPCTLDLSGAHVFAVALMRAALPASPFTLRLHEQRIGDGSQPDQMTVDLGS